MATWQVRRTIEEVADIEAETEEDAKAIAGGLDAEEWELLECEYWARETTDDE
jgi:hypothetical protein